MASKEISRVAFDIALFEMVLFTHVMAFVWLLIME
jgi:hypothetical protein